jgi:hypothetical protein
MIGLKAQIGADDGPAGKGGAPATPPVFEALVGVTEIKPPSYKTKVEDNSDLASGPVIPYLASLSDGSEITITQKYTMAAWVRNFALQQSTWPGNPAGLTQRSIRLVMPDGLQITVPVIWTEVPPADDIKAQPIVDFKSTLKVVGIPSIVEPAPAAH